jgi:hypothetical protein
MSQSVGLNFKSRIPQFSDDASIEEALKVYHYGVDNYSTQPIPNDSIEGNFRSLDDRLIVVEDALDNLSVTFIEATSPSSSPNTIIPENSSTIPLTIKGVSSQTANLQQWQDNSSTNLAVVFSNGAASFAGYISIGSVAQSTTVANPITIGDAAHKGITIRSASDQSANIQEWQNSSGTAMSWVTADGKIYQQGNEITEGNLNSNFLFMGS